jgi:O-antigen/teichoic acid export membrane protein
MVSAISIRGIFTFDRYFLNTFAGLEAVAAYVLFISLGNALVSFLDSGLFVFAYPKLIQAHESGNQSMFKQQLLTLAVQVLGISLAFFAVSATAIAPFLTFLGKKSYLDYAWMFPWALAAIVLFCWSLIPQYGLYAQGEDKKIMTVHLLSFITFLTTTLGFSLLDRPHAVILGLVSAMLINLAACTFLFFRSWRGRYAL